jgi:hypothetical protein
VATLTFTPTFQKSSYQENIIGEQRKPRPEGKSGYICTDSVHQGDQNGIKAYITLAQGMQQGNDSGTQYRSGLYVCNEHHK